MHGKKGRPPKGPVLRLWERLSIIFIIKYVTISSTEKGFVGGTDLGILMAQLI